MWWWMALALAGGEPAGELAWSPRGTSLYVHAPPGEELSADGPVTLEISVGPSELRWTGSGARLAAGIALSAESGDDVVVNGTLTSCEPHSGSCRPLAVRWRGLVPDTRRGALSLVAEAPAGHDPTPYRVDAVAVSEQAFARADRERALVLLDFGAVWCPPCNLLTAEVLHADPPPPELATLVVAALDVDDPSSWAVKDRYAVGGYPTVVVARADGTELGRIVGYPGREAWLRRVAGIVARNAPVADPGTRDPATVGGPERAAVARELVEAGRPADAERWLAGAEDGEDLRVARFAVKPTASDARWLAEHAVAPSAWVPAVLEGDLDPAIAVIARRAIDAALPTARGPVAADLLAFRAALSPVADRPLLHAAAAAALRSSLRGDPALDRGHYTFLAELQAEAGDLDGAVAFLDEQTAAFPEEPTFDLTAARLLNGAQRHVEAATRAERALPRSWGDNHLRVAAQLAEARAGLGDRAGASAIATAALAAVPSPPAGLDVRTPRYRAALETYLTPR